MRRIPVTRKVRNKHQLGKNASIKSLKRYCLEIWSEIVKERDGHRCILCGGTAYIQSHHIITRKYAPTRYNINCGISLCAGCHTFRLISAHTSPWVIYDWLKENRPKQFEWFLINKEGIKNPIKMNLDIQFYRDTLKRLLNEYEIISPQTFKKCKYTPFSNEEEIQICEDYEIKILSRRDLAMKYGTGQQIIETILNRHKIKMRPVGRRSGDNWKKESIYDDPSGK